MYSPSQFVQSDFIVPLCREEMQQIYVDDDILVVNKPSGLLSVPGRLAENKDSVANRAMALFPSASIVHRLDMDTSGLMVLALNKAAHRHLSQQFEKRSVQKRYIAIVSGHIKTQQGVVDLPIVCDWPNRPKQKIDFNDGKTAQTLYHCLEHLSPNAQHGAATRVALTPYTGRSHQLRIHMQALGHAILGCKFYACDTVLAQAPRLLLHAEQLSLSHPVSGKSLHWLCPSPF